MEAPAQFPNIFRPLSQEVPDTGEREPLHLGSHRFVEAAPDRLPYRTQPFVPPFEGRGIGRPRGLGAPQIR